MKLTLDRMCIQTGRLCASCEELYENGEISDIDIDFGKILMNAAKSQKFLSNTTLKQIIETKNKILLMVNKGDKVKFDNAGNQLLKQLKTVDQRPVLFIEKSKNAKKLLDGILAPIIPVSISTVFLPPFSEKELKIQLKKQDKESVMSAEELSIITNALLVMKAHYSFV